MTAQLPIGTYAMYLFVAPNIAIGNADRVGLSVTVKPRRTTRSRTLGVGESAMFPAFGGE